jgi:2-polyprenyl-3-methyl-5-hydroxy-6-metoxy-1,4-benzoquinol methylase
VTRAGATRYLAESTARSESAAPRPESKPLSTSAPESLYDYPVYYDVVFGSDWRAEFKFLEGVFRLHGRRPTRSLFEPACGTGRLLVPLAKAGYRVAGNDLNERAVDYCNARLKRRGNI